MHAEVESIKRDEAHKNSQLFYTDIVQVRFNAWHYIETNLWASLVEYIFSELDRWLRNERDAQDHAKYDGPHVDALFEHLATSRYLKLESYRDLIATRRDLRAAEKELQEARRSNEDALRRAAARPLDNPWAAVAKDFLRPPQEAGIERGGGKSRPDQAIGQFNGIGQRIRQARQRNPNPGDARENTRKCPDRATRLTIERYDRRRSGSCRSADCHFCALAAARYF